MTWFDITADICIATVAVSWTIAGMSHVLLIRRLLHPRIPPPPHPPTDPAVTASLVGRLRTGR